jgi:hypothetical protein
MRYVALTLLVLPLFAVTAHAQTSTIQFVVNPEVPGPNQSVSIEAQGIGGFLGDATISWKVNGKTVLSGVGERVLTFTTGAVGSRTTVHVDIQSPSQGSITRDFDFSPSNLTLLWEAQTTLPQLSRNKALYSAGSQLKIIALPRVLSGGTYVSNNNLSFQWRVNDNPMVNQSGLGRSTLVFTGDQLHKSEEVVVDVYYGSTIVAQGGISIPAVNPQVLFYDKDPLRGVLMDQALPPAVSLQGQEITLQAVPYYFAKESAQNNSLTYTWTLNGNDTTGPEAQKGILTLRQSGSGQGTASISLSVQNVDTSKIIQSATAKLQMLFGVQKSNAGSIFGL